MNKTNNVTCPHCKRTVVPRLSFWSGEPRSSWCPFCGGKIQDFYESSGIFGFVIILGFVALIVYASQ